MSDEPYARSKFYKAHRYASVIVVMMAAGIYGARFGVGVSIRAFASFVVPLALIWFADELAGWAIKDSGGWLTPRNADTGVRIAGWLILVLMLLPRAAVLAL